MKIDIEKLKSIVIEAGFSFSKLSRESGVTKQHISRIINNPEIEVRVATVGAIANALCVKFTEIIVKEEDEQWMKLKNI